MSKIIYDEAEQLQRKVQKFVDKFCSDTGYVPVFEVGRQGYYVSKPTLSPAPQLRGMKYD